MGNHLTFATDGEESPSRPTRRALDYELELGFVLAHPLRDASPETAEAAIGGFVVLNDFSARDVQLAEMASGFGPQKSKHFRSAMSKVVVTSDEILPRWRDLNGIVKLNGASVAEPSTRRREVVARRGAGARLALASSFIPASCSAPARCPDGSGIETGHALEPGDRIEIGIEDIGTLDESDRVEGARAVKVIDLSKPIRFNRGDPRFMQVRIRHKPRWTAKLLVRVLGLPRRLFPKDWAGWADDTITKMGVHSTTHIDAPWHYGPMSGGEPRANHRGDAAREMHRPRRRARPHAQGRQRPDHG